MKVTSFNIISGSEEGSGFRAFSLIDDKLFSGVYFRIDLDDGSYIPPTKYLTMYSQSELKMVIKTKDEIESLIHHGYKVFRYYLKKPVDCQSIFNVFITDDFGLRVKVDAIDHREEYDYTLLWN